jgi:SRSO17 transposase/transposase-like protein
VLERLAKRSARQPAEFWIIDETSFPKAGQHSVGVARQYCGAPGKLASCQAAVSLHRAEATGRSSQPVSWRLYLPREWVSDSERRARAGIPAEVTYQSKNELALSLLDQALGWGLKPGVVLADEAYGGSFEWRAALRERGLFYCVRVPWTTTGWTQKPEFFLPPPPKRGRQAKRLRTSAPIPKNLRTIAQELPESAWSEVSWREGRKGPQRSRFVQLELWAANGWRQGPQPERVREVALMEWPKEAAEPSRYWLSFLSETLSLAELVRAAKARWRIEQDYRELKEELGLDHFEGRGWMGWHHHVALVTAAFSFLRQEQRRRGRSRAGKKNLPEPPSLPLIRKLLQAALIRLCGRCLSLPRFCGLGCEKGELQPWKQRRAVAVMIASLKENAVALVQGGRTATQVARDLGVSTWSLNRWVAQARGGTVHSEPKTLAAETPEQRELRRLRQQVAYLERQRDILKKAVGISCRPRCLQAL